MMTRIYLKFGNGALAVVNDEELSSKMIVHLGCTPISYSEYEELSQQLDEEAELMYLRRWIGHQPKDIQAVLFALWATELTKAKWIGGSSFEWDYQFRVFCGQNLRGRGGYHFLPHRALTVHLGDTLEQSLRWIYKRAQEKLPDHYHVLTNRWDNNRADWLDARTGQGDSGHHKFDSRWTTLRLARARVDYLNAGGDLDPEDWFVFFSARIGEPKENS